MTRKEIERRIVKIRELAESDGDAAFGLKCALYRDFIRDLVLPPALQTQTQEALEELADLVLSVREIELRR